MPTGVYERKMRAVTCIIVCEGCGKEMHLTRSQMRGRVVRFCSSRCYGTSLRSPAKSCPQCGKEFRRARKKFCSAICAAESQRRPRVPRKGTISAKSGRWSDPDFIREYQRKYYQDHAASAVSKAARFAADNPAAVRAYKKLWSFKNRERIASKSLQRYHLARAKGAAKPQQIDSIISKAEGRCVYCGSHTEKLTLDHLTPIKLGGRSNARNLVPCCARCNSSKGTKPAENWLLEKFGVEGLARTIVFLDRKKIDQRLYSGGRE